MEESSHEPDMQALIANEPDNITSIDEEIIQEPPPTSIAAFWRRLLAFTIDGFLLSIPLIIIGFIFRDIAFSLGPWGRILGFSVLILYGGYFHSEQRSGQTFGKQLAKIAVVDHNNQYLSISQSFSRATILGLIFILNGWALPLLQNTIIAFFVTIVVFGGILALIYGLIFNRTTRQGIHDLLVGSYVIDAPPHLNAQTPQIPRIHKRITFGLVVGIGLLIGIAGLLLQQTEPTLGIVEPGEWEEIQELQSTLKTDGDYFSVSVNRVNRGQIGGSTVLKDLNIEVWTKVSCDRNPTYCDDLVEDIAQTAFETYGGIENLSGMQIAIVNRFDLGLASGHLTRGAARSMADWQEILENR